MAAVAGFNHVTLAVAELDRSLAFYRDLLGLTLRARWLEGAYLEAGGLWLCLSVGPVTAREDYTHLAFDVAADDFDALCGAVRAAAPQWRENRSEGASLYMLDPDGHRLELHVGSLCSRLDHYRADPGSAVEVFDAPAAAEGAGPAAERRGLSRRRPPWRPDESGP